jgi:hypothetical protein
LILEAIFQGADALFQVNSELHEFFDDLLS